MAATTTLGKATSELLCLRWAVTIWTHCKAVDRLLWLSVDIHLSIVAKVAIAASAISTAATMALVTMVGSFLIHELCTASIQLWLLPVWVSMRITIGVLGWLKSWSICDRCGVWCLRIGTLCRWSSFG